MVYDHNDSVEEALSGTAATQRVNEIVIQKVFTGPKLSPSSIAKYERQFGTCYSRNVKQEKRYMVSISRLQQIKTKHQ